MDVIKNIPDLTLMRVQAASGAVFGTFLGVHLLNHAVLNIGWDAAKAVLLAGRLYYQHPLIELVVLPGALATHITVSAIRFFRRRAAARLAAEHGAAKKDGGATAAVPAAAGPSSLLASLVQQLPWSSAAVVPRWQRLSGAFMLVVIGGHVAATRLFPLFYMPDPSIIDHGFVTISTRLLPLYFYPYYTIFGAAGVYHAVHGIGTALRVFAPDATATSAATSSVGRSRNWRIVSFVGALVLAVSIQAVGGRFYSITVPYAGDVLDTAYRVTSVDYRSDIPFATTGIRATA